MLDSTLLLAADLFPTLDLEAVTTAPLRLQMDVSTSTTTDWSKRTLKFDGEFIADEGGARGASKCLTSRDISQSRDLDISKSLDCELAPVDLEGANETGSPKRSSAAQRLGEIKQCEWPTLLF